MAATEMGLRERKKKQTRELLVDVARKLFSERGFENVSVAEIARVADVSQATVYNYFPTKEDLVYHRLETFESELLQAVRDRRSGEAVLDAFARFVLEPRGFFVVQDEQRADELIAVTRMIAASPTLVAREEQLFARFTASLAREIAAETRAGEGDIRPQVAAGALIAVHRALIAFVRDRLATSGKVDRARLRRETHTRGKAALA